MKEFNVVDMPARMARLPRDKHGRPVPWFVHWADGQPDFRVIGAGRVPDAHRLRLCWVCGQARGSYMAFVVGPMCAVNGISSEPPSHRDCAVYSATACPFLITPTMCRREARLPEHVDPPGVMLLRNPGVTLVWVTRSYELVPDHEGRALFSFAGSPPTETLWFTRGRAADRVEAIAAVDAGLPALRAAAEADADPPRALAHLQQLHTAALVHLPPAAEVAG